MFKLSRVSLLTSVGMAVLLSACQPKETATTSQVDVSALQRAVSARTPEEQSRDTSRHPVETLSFFKIEPGMKVAEALPGGGWYSKILANYLGKDGALYGINYDDHMWAKFGFFDENGIKQRIAATTEFPNKVKEFTNNGITSQGFTFASAPESLNGSVDRVLFIRALHNLSRFEKDAQTLTTALKTTHRILKKDGLVGVVQHQISEDAPEQGADGSRGYLKLSTLKKAFAGAGFELVESSDINANPKDQPSASDIVWRLPPSYFGTKDDEAKKAAVDAIGESNRMTLVFKKKN
ncbi:class I SAM-dependent methyltransferase [Paraglaciecola sp.]|uniref:class I SAM-dependent methyltransferase n=1 Tax=Paraglaciecola sp. TaxID=1920173 RepID=UPI003EF4A2EC